MDPFTTIYYAAVCAVLGAGVGPIRPIVWRLIVGALVGIIAAALLPTARGALGF